MNVLLFRQEEEPHDKYHTRFGENSNINNVSSIPVLSFEFCNLDRVKSFIENIENYSGVIFTSRRAITAFQQTISDAELQKVRSLEDFCIYVVGLSSEECVKQLGLSSIGADTGNAKELAGVIINEQSTAIKPLMFLCGNLARETIPARLTQNKIPNECISCYKTVPDQQFEQNLRTYLANYQPNIVVFFSPSGAEFYFKKIRTLIAGFGNVKVVCIGDYTREALERLGQTVHSVAAKPSPDGLYDAVEKIMNKE